MFNKKKAENGKLSSEGKNAAKHLSKIRKEKGTLFYM